MITLQTQYWQNDESTSGSVKPKIDVVPTMEYEAEPTRYEPQTQPVTFQPQISFSKPWVMPTQFTLTPPSYQARPLLDADRAEELLQSARIFKCKDQTIMPPDQQAFCCVTFHLKNFSFNFGFTETRPTTHDYFAP